MIKSQREYYRKLQRFLHLKKLIDDKLDLDIDRIGEDFEAGVKVGSKTGASGRLELVHDYPIVLKGDSKSVVEKMAMTVLQDEQNEIEDYLLKTFPTLIDFDKLHNKIRYDDLPPKHIVTDNDYKQIWYNGQIIDLNPHQAKFLKIVHKRFLETDKQVFDSHSVFEEMKYEGS